MVEADIFEEIKSITNGYLKSSTYYEIFKVALEAVEGNVIDIGPAQGGSTICFGLAKMENPHLNTIYSIDKFCGSAALKEKSIESNIDVLYDNLSKFQLGDEIVALAVDRDMEEIFNIRKPISVLFIDADGAIDRDFNLFYNKLSPGAAIIIDDCEEIINLHASKVYLKIQNEGQLKRVLKNKGYSKLKEYTPLGKQFTTYQFVKYLIENNYIQINKIIDGTVFAVKPENAPEFNFETMNEMDKLRDKITDLYWSKQKLLRLAYDALNEDIRNIANLLEYANALVFENFYYAIKDRMQTTRVYEWHQKDDDWITCDQPLLSISFEDISEIIEPLKENRELFLVTEFIKNKKIKNYFALIQIKEMSIFPIFINESFWGFTLFYEKINDSCYEHNHSISKKKYNLHNLIRESELERLFEHLKNKVTLIKDKVNQILD